MGFEDKLNGREWGKGNQRRPFLSWVHECQIFDNETKIKRTNRERKKHYMKGLVYVQVKISNRQLIASDFGN